MFKFLSWHLLGKHHFRLQDFISGFLKTYSAIWSISRKFDKVMQLYFSILVIICSSQLHNVVGKCRPSTYSINSHYLAGHVMSTRIVSSLSECVIICVTDVHCKSLNFHSIDGLCDLNDADRRTLSKDFRPKIGCIYMEMFPSFKVCYFNIFPVLKREIQNDLLRMMMNFISTLYKRTNQKFIVILFHSRIRLIFYHLSCSVEVLCRNTTDAASGKEWILLDTDWEQRSSGLLWYDELW